MDLVLSLQKLPFGEAGTRELLDSSASATCSATSVNTCPVFTTDQQLF